MLLAKISVAYTRIMAMESDFFTQQTDIINADAEFVVDNINQTLDEYIALRLQERDPALFRLSQEAQAIAQALFVATASRMHQTIARTPERLVPCLTVGDQPLESYRIWRGPYDEHRVTPAKRVAEPGSTHELRQITRTPASDTPTVYIGGTSLFSLDDLATNKQAGGTIETTPSA